MSQTLDLVRQLARDGKIKISEHGYDELAADGLFAGRVIAGLGSAELLEDYPNFPKGPCALVLQYDEGGRPVHAVWGVPAGQREPAVLITAYRPDPKRWSADFRRRMP